jgi:uncharacterized protein with HEPN domain
MKKRNEEVYLNDVLESIKKIERYTKGVRESGFCQDSQLQDAVLKRLEIIGEAVKNISVSIRKKHSEIPWKEIAGLRDVLIHEYFGVNQKRVWKVIINRLPILKKQIKQIIKAI